MDLMKFGFLGALVCLSACNNPMNAYVEATVTIKPQTDQVTALADAGTLTFRHTTYSTEYRTVCDEVPCGDDMVEVCTAEPRCGTTSDGRYVCEGEHRSCHTEWKTRYCSANCREEPYTVGHTTKIFSPIRVHITGDIKPEEVSKINTIALGVHTKDLFRKWFTDPTSRNKDFAPVFEHLSQTDDAVLVMVANGFQLAPGAEFLKLPEGFTSGQPIDLEVPVQRVDAKGNLKSAIGTPTQLPPLQTSSW